MEPVCKISGQKEGILTSGMGEIPETPVLDRVSSRYDYK